MPQEQKWWHFKFRHITDEQLFTRAMEEIGINTVTYNYTNKNAPDVSLINNGTLLGKIHFLHMNRPDVKDKSKYYVKLHLFYFSSKEMFDKVKNAIIVFFDTLRSHPRHKEIQKQQKQHKQSIPHKQNAPHTPHKHHKRTHKHRRKRERPFSPPSLYSSVYLSIRQRTSAYVSIRQHTCEEPKARRRAATTRPTSQQ